MTSFDQKTEKKMKRKMSSERAVEAFAGFMVLLSVALTYLVHPLFVWLTVFVGANLLQQSFTGFCPATIILKKVFSLETEAEIARQELPLR